MTNPRDNTNAPNEWRPEDPDPWKGLRRAGYFILMGWILFMFGAYYGAARTIQLIESGQVVVCEPGETLK